MSPINLGAMGAPTALPNVSLILPPSDDSVSFSDVLKNAVAEVNQVNDGAAAQVNNLIQGGNADMNNVMIAVEKADVSFQLMMQVRNKIVGAYQEIEKMQF
jgi:flagellar hook-basal body complex protein FliE